MNTPPAEADEAHELASPPPERDTPERHIDRTLADLIPGNQEALTASWERLLHQLREETETVKRAGSDIIPGIDFEHLRCPVPLISGHLPHDSKQKHHTSMSLSTKVILVSLIAPPNR